MIHRLHNNKILRLFALLTIVVAITIAFFNTTVRAENVSFREFYRDYYPDYLTNADDIAQEIAYYANYIRPLLFDPDVGCLGKGSPLKDANVGADEQPVPIVYLTRCSHVHASDYARLNYIVALNSAIPNENDDENSLKVASEGDTDGFWFGNIALKRIMVYKNPNSLLFNPFVDNEIDYVLIQKNLIPNINLSNDLTAELFGYTPQSQGDEHSWEDFQSFSIFLASSLKDCSEFKKANLADDKILSDRVITLNPKIRQKFEDQRTAALKGCEDQCQVEREKSNGLLKKHLLSDEIRQAAAWQEIEKDDGSYVPIQDKGCTEDVFEEEVNSLVSHYANPEHGQSLKGWGADVIDKEQNTLTESCTSGILEEDKEWEERCYCDKTLRVIAGDYLKDLETLVECQDNCKEYYKIPENFDPKWGSSCGTLRRILEQSDYPDEVKTIYNMAAQPLAERIGPKWLPLTDSEKSVMKFGSDLSANKGATKVKLIIEEETSTCRFTGIKSLICTFTRFLGFVTNSAYSVLSHMLTIPPEIVQTGTPSGRILYQIWKIFRDIANIVLIIIVLTLVFSQVSGWKANVLDLKKIFPRIIAAAILINLSFIICQLAVDASNLLGSSLRKLFQLGSETIIDKSGITTGSSNSAFLGIVLLILASGVAILIFLANLVVLIPTIVGGLMVIAGIILILIMRQLAVILLIILAPIVFAFVATPTGTNIIKRWWQTLFAIIIVYPSISAVFGAGEFAYHVVSIANEAGAGSLTVDILATSLLFLPLVAVPSIVKKVMTNLPVLGDKINELASKLPGAAKQKISSASLIKAAQLNKARNAQLDKMGRSRPSRWTHPLRRIRSSFNRNIINKSKLYSHRLAAGGEADPERMKEYITGRYKLGSGDDTLEKIRKYNSGDKSNNLKTQSDKISAMLTIADDGAGYFEEVVTLANSISKTGIEQADMAEVMERTISDYQENGRVEVVALLKKYRDITGGSYNMSVAEFNQALLASEKASAGAETRIYEEIVSKELVRRAAYQSGIRFKKFSGFDSSDSSRTGSKPNAKQVAKITAASRSLGGTQILSTNAGFNAYWDLGHDSSPAGKAFRRYIKANYTSMTPTTQEFIDKHTDFTGI